MKDTILKVLGEFAKWDTCPIEIKIPKDKFMALSGELLMMQHVREIGTDTSPYWIDFNGPVGKCRVVPG